jgi:hypothetical protein
MKFLKNPYHWFLSYIGYEEVPTSLLKQHMLDFTNQSHFQTVRDQGRIYQYEVKLYTNFE